MNQNMLLFSSMYAQYVAFIQQLDKQEVNTKFLNECVGWMYQFLHKKSHAFLLCSRQKTDCENSIMSEFTVILKQYAKDFDAFSGYFTIPWSDATLVGNDNMANIVSMD